MQQRSLARSLTLASNSCSLLACESDTGGSLVADSLVLRNAVSSLYRIRCCARSGMLRFGNLTTLSRRSPPVQRHPSAPRRQAWRGTYLPAASLPCAAALSGAVSHPGSSSRDCGLLRLRGVRARTGGWSCVCVCCVGRHGDGRRCACMRPGGGAAEGSSCRRVVLREAALPGAPGLPGGSQMRLGRPACRNYIELTVRIF
jgi:hypothetical protein